LVTELDRAKESLANRAAAPDETQVTAATGPADGLAGVGKQSDHPCFDCVRCCTYVAIEIDVPTAMKEYDYIVWYLYHQNVSVFVDWEGDWFIKFETRCQHLTPGGLCDVYASRPVICKDFDWRECENRIGNEPADKWLFETSDEFLRWFEKRKPKTFRRFQKYMRKKHGAGEEKELGRLTAIRPPGK